MSSEIKQEVGSRIVIRDGRDYDVPVGRIIQSTFSEATEQEKAIYISQGKAGISISFESLLKIVEWASKNSEQG